jgi:hypothetical protein
MVITKGVNSYVSLAEAIDYFESRLDSDAWTSTTEERQESALMTATSILDDLAWNSVAIGDLLHFPAEGSYFDPRLGREITLDPLIVPARIIQATYEMAYHLLSNSELVVDSGRVLTLAAGSTNISGIQGAALIPAFVKRIVRPLLANGGSNSWWRAN